MLSKKGFFLIILISYCCYSLADVPLEAYILSPSTLTLLGTKYCGPGNTAKNYNDLGWAEESDKCCRTHDFCPDIIEANGRNHGLTNTSSYTRLLCDCDRVFLNCLKNVKEGLDAKIAAGIGYLYFNLLDTKCFEYQHQVTGCEKYPDSDRCEKYTFDQNSQLSWQWFDEPFF